MTILKGRAQEIFEKMEKEWKVVTLSREASFAIEREIAEVFIKAKKDFERKHAASRRYIAEIESTTVEV